MNAENGTPNMDQLWEDFVRDASRLDAERRPWVLQQVCDAIRRARRGQSYMTAVHVSVMVPKCMSCVHDEARATGASGLPEVYGTGFAMDYARLGFSRRQIQAIKHALQDGSWRPRCYYSCGSTIDVIGEGFSVRHTDISAYFGFDPHIGRKPREWMKEAVLRIFGRKCAGCKKRLTHDQVTFDHIIPASRGGLTEIGNLQPLCQRCNATKGNKTVSETEVVLTFPLCPPPSDGYEGVIW